MNKVKRISRKRFYKNQGLTGEQAHLASDVRNLKHINYLFYHYGKAQVRKYVHRAKEANQILARVNL